MPQRSTEDLSDDNWALTDKPYGMSADDDPKSAMIPPVRIQGQWVGLARELREDVESIYYQLYPSPTAMYRDLLIKGLLAMAEQNKTTRSKAREMRIREAALARIVHNKSRRQRVELLVEPLIHAMKEDVESDDVDSAAEFLDSFLGDVAKMDEEDGREFYAKGLLNHPEFQRLRHHRGVREKSKLLSVFEEEYGKE